MKCFSLQKEEEEEEVEKQMPNLMNQIQIQIKSHQVGLNLLINWMQQKQNKV